MEDNKRFSVLRPLTSQELKFYTIELINFFNPLNNKKIENILDYKSMKEQLDHLS